MILYYGNLLREETDPNLIELALSKGWKERPSAPECSVDEMAEWDLEKGQWTISTKPIQIVTFQDELDKGFYVESEGFYLAMQDSDRNQWTALRSQLLDGLSMEKITHDTPILIWDNEGKPHQITVNKIREILFDAGIWYIQLSAKYKLG